MAKKVAWPESPKGTAPKPVTVTKTTTTTAEVPEHQLPPGGVDYAAEAAAAAERERLGKR